MDSRAKAFTRYSEARAYADKLAEAHAEARAIYTALSRYGAVAYYVGTVRQLQRRFGAGAPLVLVLPYRKVNRKESERREIYAYYCNLRGCNAIKRVMDRYGLSESSVYRIIREFNGSDKK